MRVDFHAAKRGDTIVEVMFAIAIFSLVAIISIAMMNMGVRQAEGALEAVTARNEINAQVEALRFIHSSYISEMTLPECGSATYTGDNANRCQQYTKTWNDIIGNAVTAAEAEDTGLLSLGSKVMDGGCRQFYEIGDNGKTLLGKVNAFVINTRDVNADNHINNSGSVNHTTSSSYIGVNSHNRNSKLVFQQAELSPRILYTYVGGTGTTDDNVSDSTTLDAGDITQVVYDEVLNVEGLWVFAVQSDEASPTYYDFYVEACWNPPNSSTPSTLDTVIRLYNPNEVRYNG